MRIGWRIGWKFSPTKLSWTLFVGSLPLTGFSLIQSENLVRAFAPSLFLSLPFLLLHIWKNAVLRSPLIRRFIWPSLIISVAGLISIWMNSLNPPSILVATPNMVIEEVTIGIRLLERYSRLVFSLLVVGTLVALILNNEKSMRSFCNCFIGGYSVGAVFGLIQLVAEILGLPFWTPFGGAKWMMSHQATDYGFSRINGGAPEPSHWAPFSLMAIAFILISAKGRFSWKQWALLALASINLLFTLSGSAIVGLVGILVGTIVSRITYLTTLRINPIKTATYLFGVPILLGAFYLLISRVEFFNSYIGQGLIEKMSGKGDSGTSRLYILVLTWNAFFVSPIYGVGVGAVASFNTFLTILASGGLFFFVPYIYMVIVGGYRTLIKYRRERTASNFGWLILFWSMLFITSFSYGEIFSFFSWIWIFLCFAIPLDSRFGNSETVAGTP